MNVDGGRSNKAMQLAVGELSERFLSSNGDGFYYVKLIEKNDSQVNYDSLKINLTEFDLRVMKLYEDGEVEEYINLDSDGEEG